MATSFGAFFSTELTYLIRFPPVSSPRTLNLSVFHPLSERHHTSPIDGFPYEWEPFAPPPVFLLTSFFTSPLNSNFDGTERSARMRFRTLHSPLFVPSARLQTCLRRRFPSPEKFVCPSNRLPLPRMVIVGSVTRLGCSHTTEVLMAFF